jgi:hypothetical protein
MVWLNYLHPAHLESTQHPQDWPPLTHPVCPEVLQWGIVHCHLPDSTSCAMLGDKASKGLAATRNSRKISPPQLKSVGDTPDRRFAMLSNKGC